MNKILYKILIRFFKNEPYIRHYLVNSMGLNIFEIIPLFDPKVHTNSRIKQTHISVKYDIM